MTTEIAATTLSYLLLLLLVAILYLLLVSRPSRARLRAWKKWAESHDFQFETVPSTEARSAWPPWQVLTLGDRKRTVSNLMTGRLPGQSEVTAHLFDVAYTWDYGISIERRSRTVQQTVLMLSSNRLDLPRFRLLPRHLMDKQHPEFPVPGIQFKQDEAFTETYYLNGDNPTQVKALFDDGVRTQIDWQRIPSLEGEGRYLLVWYENVLVDGAALDALLEFGRTVLNTLSAHPGA